MKIPSDETGLIRFARDTTEECLVSREARRLQYGIYRRLFYTGSQTNAPSKHNKCYSHIDKLTSYLFSPADVRFDVELENGNADDWTEKLTSAGRFLNRKFNRRDCGLTFGQATEGSLVDGCCIVKLVWGSKGLEPWVISPEFFGVQREDIPSLERQEAFVHSFFVTKEVFGRMIGDHPDRAMLMELVDKTAVQVSSEELSGDSYLHEMVLGGQIGAPGVSSPAQSYGAVGIAVMPAPVLGTEVRARLIEVRDLWVWDDDRNDWTNIRVISPDIIIEGKYKHRNTSGIPGRHPFFRVCSNEVRNYFWGRSELATVYEAQLLLNARLNDIDAIFRLQARPPRAFSGFTGITPEKARALLTAGGSIVEGSNPNATVKNLAPEMPANALDYLELLDTYFDEAAGFTPILSGQGEPGVRTGVQAGTLLRTSTPRLRDRALLVEKQAAEFGTGCLNMLKAQEPLTLTTETGEQFMLSQLPDDAYATVDSHSASPAFSEEIKQLAFAYAKAGVIDGEDLLEMTQPPRQDVLVARYRKRQAAQAQAAAQNPEALQAMQGGKKKS